MMLEMWHFLYFVSLSLSKILHILKCFSCFWHLTISNSACTLYSLYHSLVLLSHYLTHSFIHQTTIELKTVYQMFIDYKYMPSLVLDIKIIEITVTEYKLQFSEEDRLYSSLFLMINIKQLFYYCQHIFS